MIHDQLYHIQEAKALVESPPLDESALTTEKDSSLPIKRWTRWTNQSQQLIQNDVVIPEFEDWLVKKETITFTDGTREYDIPTNTIKIRLVERTDVDTDREMYPLRGGIGDKFYFRSDMDSNTREYYTFWGNQIYVLPEPADSTATMQLWLIRKMADLSYGTASAADATTITLAAAPTFGDTSTQDDYYNGSKIYIVSGTNSGQAVPVTDYAGSTGICTVASWPGGTPSGTIVYSFLSDIPSEYDAVLAARTALFAKIKDNADITQLSSHYQELKTSMIKGMSQRQIQESTLMGVDIDVAYVARQERSLYTEDYGQYLVT